MRALTLLVITSLACRNQGKPSDKDTIDTSESTVDADGDGYEEADDCDDLDGAVNPGAAEICDGLDNNCDGNTDEDSATDAATWYTDADSDGYGDPDESTAACTQPDGTSEDATDCNDSDPDTHPGAAERCDDTDNDCDGDIDEDVLGTWYPDADGDDFGDGDAPTDACDPGDGFVADDSDCDDTDAGVHPGAEEICNEQDDDCDGEVDELVTTTYYVDGDEDGYGDADASADACELPTGYAETDDDCDDGDAAVNPGAAELCNEVDDDCDGTIDEDDASDASSWYADTDSDGFGDPRSGTRACAEPRGYTADATDCDDTSGAVNPDATELCNEVDDDCDGTTDEDDASDASTWYADTDSDGFGDDATSTEACDRPAGFTSDDTDCDDDDDDINPDATELCNEVDDDCDGTIDEDDASDASTWYADDDSDGFGDASSSTLSCETPAGYTGDDTDCDDADSDINPDATEIWNSEDDDCDGDTDEGLYAGTGADGSITLSAADMDLSVDTSGGRAYADAIAYSVSSLGTDTVTATEEVLGIEAGDEVLVINLQGSDSYSASVGAYEFGTVASVSGATLTLARALGSTYGEVDNTDLTDQIIVVQRVPNYEDVFVGAGYTLSGGTWDGAMGGVLAFRASGTVWVESTGTISVSGLGYAGGATGTSYNCDSYQGESYVGEGDGDGDGACTAYNETYGHWAPNAGGGGAHINGAGGNYAGGATDGDSWTGGSATPPEAGETYGAEALSTLFFGSGGGGVWYGSTTCTGDGPGTGGDGAGILYVGATDIITDDANALVAIGGSSNHCARGTWTYGAGGGAGGSIFLAADSVDLASGSVAAGGGTGNSSNIRAGGDGGYGRVRIDCNDCDGYSQGSTDAASALQDAAEPDPGHSAAVE